MLQACQRLARSDEGQRQLLWPFQCTENYADADVDADAAGNDTDTETNGNADDHVSISALSKYNAKMKML